jgi:hypothetical protein
MFRHDFEKQAKMDGPKVETEVLAARGPRGCSSNTTNRGTTAGTPTIPDASDHRDEFVDLAKAEDASANPWLSNIADVRQAGEKVSVIVSSRMVEMSISDNAETMDALTRAARKMFGVTTIVIERGHVRVSERKMVTA